MAKRKPRPEPAQPPGRLEKLALYNAERARGIVHTPEWDARMAEYQADFDKDLTQEAEDTAADHVYQGRKRINLAR